VSAGFPLEAKEWPFAGALLLLPLLAIVAAAKLGFAGVERRGDDTTRLTVEFAFCPSRAFDPLLTAAAPLLASRKSSSSGARAALRAFRRVGGGISYSTHTTTESV
jgi:hypothetical protein